MREALNHLKAADARLGGVIDAVGPYRIQYKPPAFPTLVQAIIYQQLSGKAASTILRRLSDHLDGSVTPDAIMGLRRPSLRKLGVSPQKTSYLKDLARRTASGALRFEELPAMSDEEVVAALTAVKGIGVWTAHMFLIFALRRPDVLPVGDLGIRNAIQRLYALEASPAPAEIEQLGARWRPWCSVASWYLWRSLDGEAAL